jgi:hypothetical protein
MSKNYVVKNASEAIKYCEEHKDEIIEENDLKRLIYGFQGEIINSKFISDKNKKKIYKNINIIAKILDEDYK